MKSGCICRDSADAAALFLWKSRVFQQFSTRRKSAPSDVENLHGLHSSGEKALYSWEEPVKKEKKTARLSFGKKKKLPHFSPETTMENAGKYFTYKNQTGSSGKLGGKSGKHRGKLALFFTNAVENPVEKVDKSIRKAQKWIQPAVLAEGGSDSQPPFVHRDFLEWLCQT